jgi:hypothetical protein
MSEHATCSAYGFVTKNVIGEIFVCLLEYSRSEFVNIVDVLCQYSH